MYSDECDRNGFRLNPIEEFWSGIITSEHKLAVETPPLHRARSQPQPAFQSLPAVPNRVAPPFSAVPQRLAPSAATSLSPQSDRSPTAKGGEGEDDEDCDSRIWLQSWKRPSSFVSGLFSLLPPLSASPQTWDFGGRQRRGSTRCAGSASDYPFSWVGLYWLGTYQMDSVE